MKGIFLCLSLFISNVLPGQDTTALPISGTMVHVLRFGAVDSPVLLYNMHDNENSSALAGRLLAKQYAITYFELVHNGKRNISFAWNEDSIHIDPNRIYTDMGVWQQLARNKNTDTLAFEMIASWRDSLLSIINPDGRSLVIALHNNTNKFYGFKSYMPEGEYAAEADAIHQGCVRDKDDFYFVTDSGIMAQLMSGQYHVILQANAVATDDGSLSVLCGQLNIPYVNVEAQHGHFMRQWRMLQFAFRQLAQ